MASTSVENIASTSSTSAPPSPQIPAYSYSSDFFPELPRAITHSAQAQQSMDTRRDSLTLPPPYYSASEYASDAPVPAYEEPITLSRYLFKWGFLFFPFWFIGAILLFNPLRPLPQTECGRTEEEQKEDLLIVRNTELKWSWRCVYALLGLALLVGVIVLLVLTLSGLRR